MASTPNGKKENILTSWKEIAVYLDHDVRTCVRWEQRYGLPIHRLDRDSKGKVFAYKEQIDEWLAARAANGTSRPENVGRRPGLVRAFPLVFALAGLAAAAYFLFLRPPIGPGLSAPAGFDISGSRLVVLDGKARELWPFDTGLADLETGDFYREHFQEKRHESRLRPGLAPAHGPGPRRRCPARGPLQHPDEVRGPRGDPRLLRLDAERRALALRGRPRAPIRRPTPTAGSTASTASTSTTTTATGPSRSSSCPSTSRTGPARSAVLDAAGKLEGEYWNAGLPDGRPDGRRRRRRREGDRPLRRQQRVRPGLRHRLRGRRAAAAPHRSGRPATAGRTSDRGPRPAYILFPEARRPRSHPPRTATRSTISGSTKATA
ncbi:MAG: hypothetical protein MZV63_58850 [Marinilabiliales bacterium]|nr:hypothetical protein [Marinilabiliales bacterium]